jgi:hypothetical protein
MENTIITDEEEIQQQFKDLYAYLQHLPQKVSADTLSLEKPQEKAEEEFEQTADGHIKYVRAIIKNEKGEILQFVRAKKQFFATPGGKIDKGETVEEALAREIQEELGVEVNASTYLGEYLVPYA